MARGRGRPLRGALPSRAVTWVALAVFVLTYALIATRRLSVLPIGRPAGALLGAVLMVATGALAPGAALEAVDADTLVLLFGTMALSGYLERSGLFDRLGLLASRTSPRGLLVATAIVPGVLSAFLLNDAICLFLAPIVVHLCATRKLPFAPYLIALATSANLGSAATLVGNPQNMIVGSLSHYGFVAFLRAVGPASVAGLAINAVLLFVFFARRLPAAMPEASEAMQVRRGPLPRLTAAVSVLVAVALLCGLHLGFTLLAGVMVLVLADRREPNEVFAKVDWSLLVFFACLFIVVHGLDATGLPARAWAQARDHVSLDSPLGLAGLTALLAIGSNVVSNVPVILLVGPHLAELGQPERAWALCGFVTTVAGNLTLVGSVANLIVAERAKSHYELGFLEHLRFGLVSSVLVLVAGVPLVVWMT